jgi:hypothetical protein
MYFGKLYVFVYVFIILVFFNVMFLQIICKTNQTLCNTRTITCSIYFPVNMLCLLSLTHSFSTFSQLLDQTCIPFASE